MPPRKPARTRAPGESEAIEGQAAGDSDVDEAIALASQGRARKIAKPRAPVAPSKVKGDPQRPADAAVNAKKEMTYDEAMEALGARFELDGLKKIKEPSDEQRERMRALAKVALQRNVLTERGWVCVNREPPAMARA